METFDIYMREIIHKQQVLESLKSGCQNIDPSSDLCARKIFAGTRHKPQTEQIEQILAYSFVACNLLFLLFFFSILISASIPDSDPITSDQPQYPIDFAQAAIQSGDYDTARTILLEQMELHPYGSALFYEYAELCRLEGDQEQAAITLINFLNLTYGTQNITENNLLYCYLKDLTGPFSHDVRKAYKECISACEKSIENFTILDTLMDNEEYQLALQLCDSLKQENVSDERLYTYYRECYKQLGMYEECADYFLGLADEWISANESRDPLVKESLYTRMPLDTFISRILEDLRPYVSETTQQRIDEANLLLDSGS